MIFVHGSGCVKYQQINRAMSVPVDLTRCACTNAGRDLINSAGTTFVLVSDAHNRFASASAITCTRSLGRDMLRNRRSRDGMVSRPMHNTHHR